MVLINKLKIDTIIKLSVISSLLCLVFFIFAHKSNFNSLDLGRHLKNGEMIMSNPDVLYKNYYSFTEPDFPFINHHWLAGVIFYLVFLCGGFKLLTGFNVLLAIITFLVFFELARKSSNFWIASLLSVPVILIMSERTDIRPEMFSYLFIGLVLYLIDLYEKRKRIRDLYWLLPLMFLWVNIHIYYFLGIFVFGLYVFFKVVNIEQLFSNPPKIKNLYDTLKLNFNYHRKLVILFFASLAVCLLNPNFYHGLLYPLSILKTYGYDIVENKSPFYLEHLTINYNINLLKYIIAFLAASYLAAIFLKAKISFYKLIMAFSFLYLGISAIRNISLFSLIVLPIAAQNIYPGWKYIENKKNKIIIIAIIYFIIFFGTANWLSGDYRNGRIFMKHPFGFGLTAGDDDSIKFFRKNNLKGPIFNNYDNGSALIFWLFQKEKVFVDNRPEAYSVAFFNETYKPMLDDPGTWDKLSAKYGINTIYLTHTDGTPWARKFISNILSDKNWPLVYLDQQTMILAKNNDANKSLIKEYKIDKIAFSQRIKALLAETDDIDVKFNLADLANLAGYNEEAIRIVEDISLKQPENGRALVQLGYYAIGRQNNDSVIKSINYFEKAIQNGFILPSVYVQMGLNYYSLGDISEAKKMWQKALIVDKKNAAALDYLKQLKDAGM